ncbi:protein polyglycylase TTLL10 [Callorhinchus milii]|nr:protein polyglycylase TTLL10 [Callorhinchus milii]|eukprot:gi/632977053/ref/XP_007905134.1/ PREDICTED: protein polyglycylase TTLL10-like isoform X2 [Callorhinchus milii]
MAHMKYHGAVADQQYHILSQDQSGDATNSRINKSKRYDYRGTGPFFYIGGANGADLVSNFCENRGWKRIYDNNRTDYILKWCELKLRINYQNFQQGKQMLNHIPNNKILTTKAGLCSSLKDYERVMSKYTITPSSGRGMKLDDFYPETYRMDMKKERQTFFEVFREGQIWICKPAESSLGRGIFLLRNREDLAAFRSKLESVTENPHYRCYLYTSPIHRVVQRYIHNPLLLDGRKFDVRSFFLIACTSPYVTFFHHGYVKLTCNKYDPNSDDLTGHLTNQFIQKKNPNYNDVKDETIWSMERLNKYINETFMVAKALQKDWVFTVFAKKMQQIMMQCFISAKSKLESKLGYFDLLGCDFMIDQNFKVWLLEMNGNPSLYRTCDVLRNVIPSLVSEALDLVVEIFTKSNKQTTITPLQAQKDFVLLYNACSTEPNVKNIVRAKTDTKTAEKSSVLKRTGQLSLNPLKRLELKHQKKSEAGAAADSSGLPKVPHQKSSSSFHGPLPELARLHTLYTMKTKSKSSLQSSSQMSGASSVEHSHLKSSLELVTSKEKGFVAQYKAPFTKRILLIPPRKTSVNKLFPVNTSLYSMRVNRQLDDVEEGQTKNL